LFLEIYEEILLILLLYGYSCARISWNNARYITKISLLINDGGPYAWCFINHSFCNYFLFPLNLIKSTWFEL
jgi:hypothetical protein